LLQAAAAMRDKPMVIIHGTHDLICPPENAIQLKLANPQARLMWVERGTHTPADPLIAAALQHAIAELRQAG
jgi:proline iminopeptidase